MDDKTKAKILKAKKPDNDIIPQQPEPVQTGLLDTVKGWFSPASQIPLEEKVANLKIQADEAERRAKLTEEGMLAQKRISMAEKRRHLALQQSPKKKGLSTPSIIIMIVFALVLIFILSRAMKC